MNERSIFLAALDIPDPARRAAYLDEACAADAAVRRGVEELLAAHERSGSFMPDPAAGSTVDDDPPGEGPGDRVGPYKLLQRIGEGGMGVVFMAEQEQPVRRTVALKIIRAGLDSKAVLARFEAERQALALMDHPNIAKVLDAGSTESGRPYFVMELVKGVPITKFCDEHQLTVRERLSLFVPVCQAIQHAHQKGVIHRDIKPSNVLVAEYDDRAVPKVIDFGVAKATSQKLTEKTLFTAFGTVVGTLEYMSPEQAKMNQLDIDTRSDVYTLGVLLYELLTGTTPLDRARLKSAALDEVLRLIREEEPVRPSTRLSTAQTRPAIAAARRAESGKLGQVLRGELDWIVMKALEKDRTRRYETANGLAKDVERYLKDEPVEACPPTVGYRLRKVYRKNRAAVFVAAAFLLLLSLATIVSGVLAMRAGRAERLAHAERDRAEQGQDEAERQRQQAERERDRAERERRRADEEKKAAQAVRDFLTDDLLRQASPLAQAESLRRAGAADTGPKPNPTVNELLDRAVAQLTPDRLEARFPGLPFVQAEVLRTVGVTYGSIGERYQVVLGLLKRAHDLYLKSRGPDDRATLNVRHSLALAHLHLDRFAEGKRLLESVRDDKVRVLGPYDRDTFATQLSLGLVLAQTSRPADAIAHLRKLRDAAREHLGPDDIDTLYVTGALAMACQLAARHEEAIQELEGLWSKLRRLKFRFDHPGVQQVVQWMDATYKAAGRYEDAIAVLKEALAGLEKANGAANPETWYLRHQLAWRYFETNRPELAVPLFQKNVAAADNAAKVAATHESLSKVFKKMGRTDDALAHLKKSVDSLPKANAPEQRSWANGMARYRLGQALLDDERFAEAESALAAAYEELTASISQRPFLDKFHPGAMTGLIADINKALGRPDAVKKWVAMRIPGGEINVARLRKQLPNNAEAFLGTSRALCWAYADAGRNAEAVKLFEEALAVFKALPEDTDYQAIALVSYRHAVTQAGRPDLAIEMSRLILEALRKRPNTSELSIASELYELGYHLCHARRDAEAETTLRESLAIQNRLAPDHWTRVMVKFWLATALFRQKKYAEAEPMLLESYKEAVERIRQARLWHKRYPADVADRLIELYTALGKPDEVKKWRAERAKYDEPVKKP